MWRLDLCCAACIRIDVVVSRGLFSAFHVVTSSHPIWRTSSKVRGYVPEHSVNASAQVFPHPKGHQLTAHRPDN
jgi:hypothetical protein